MLRSDQEWMAYRMATLDEENLILTWIVRHMLVDSEMNPEMSIGAWVKDGPCAEILKLIGGYS